MRAIIGPQSYLLKEYEELWSKELSPEVETLLRYETDVHLFKLLWAMVATTLYCEDGRSKIDRVALTL